MPHARNHATKSLEWIVLCDGRCAQIYTRDSNTVLPVFETPLNAHQLQHEMRWHFRIPTAAPRANLLDNLARLLCHAHSTQQFESLVLVCPMEHSTALCHKLSPLVLSSLGRVVPKDLTHCHSKAIAAYFA